MFNSITRSQFLSACAKIILCSSIYVWAAGSLLAKPLDGTRGHIETSVVQSSVKSKDHVTSITEENFDDASKATICIRLDDATYRVRDEVYEEKATDPDIANSAGMYVYNTDGDAYYPEFHMSPDRSWLFVTRKGAHDVSFGYLFHRTAKGFIPVHFPGGLRLDEETLRRYGKSSGSKIKPSDRGYNFHLVLFRGWKHGSKEIEFWAADTHVAVTVRYEVNNGTFHLISRDFS